MDRKETPYSDSYRKKLALAKSKSSSGAKRKAYSEDKIEKIVRDIKRDFAKKPLKFERYVVFFIYLSIFFIGGYFLIANTNPNVLPSSFHKYEISASSVMMGNHLRSLYLKDSGSLGNEVKIYNESARLIVSGVPLQFVFNPRRVIGDNATAKIQLSFIHPWTDVYLNDRLIIPNLLYFENVANFSNKQVWVRKSLLKTYYIKENNSFDFIYANYPGRNFYAFGGIQGGRPVISDYRDSETDINTRFRGNLKLAVYAKGDLTINFIKQDLNNYIGKDEYTVNITDLDGNVYYSKTFGDDGDDKKGKGDFKQKITIAGRELPENIYYVTFTIDKNNKWIDSTIENIKINSNKVLIIGKVLPISSFRFYVKSKMPQEIGFLYWHTNKYQKIKVSDSYPGVIDLNKSWKGIKYRFNVSSGEHYFLLPKGDLWVYSHIISPSKENWFYFPRVGGREFIRQDIIVTDRNSLKIDGKDVDYNGIINIKDGMKIRVQVLDKLRTYFKDIKLTLK